jgi:hypothetical protein
LLWVTPVTSSVKETYNASRSTPAKADAQTSYLDELERLAELNKQGILTDEEFAAKKKQLLDP